MVDTATSSAPAETPNYAETGMSLEQAVNFDFDDGNGADADDAGQPEPEDQDEGAEQADPDEPEGEDSENAEDPDGEGSEDDGDDEGKGQPETYELEPSAYDKTRVTLPDGRQSTVAELVGEHLMEKDYRVKTHALGEKTRAVDAQAAKVVGVYETLIDHLAQHLPDEPDTSLLFSGDAQKQAMYHRQKALHDGALQQLQGLAQLAGQAKQAQQALTQEQFSQIVDRENEKLVYALPELKDPKARQQFDQRAAMVAQAIGYTPQELARATDHRQYVMAYYAAIGIESLQAKAKVQKKIVNAPPVRPVDKRGPSPSEGRARRNREAITRLHKTGSLKDALQIDFD